MVSYFHCFSLTEREVLSKDIEYFQLTLCQNIPYGMELYTENKVIVVKLSYEESVKCIPLHIVFARN